jgi:hypothetical protein
MTLPPDDVLLTLKDACKIYFAGAVTPATLKAEHARGNLALSKIGRAWFTTLADLKTMREKCRVEAPALGSGSTRAAKLGPLSTDESASAQAAALKRLSERKKSLGITSRLSTPFGKARIRSSRMS